MLARLELLSRGRCGPLEAGLAAVLLLAVGFTAFGRHVANGGFLVDDWNFAGTYRTFARDGGFFSALSHFYDFLDGRPVEAAYHAVVEAVLGANMAVRLSWTVVLGVVVSALLFALLRRLGVERVHAAAIAVLALLFPASDATRLWSNGALYSVAVALYLGGALVALHGLSRSGRRAAFLHAVALTLYGASVLLPEVTTGAIAVTVLLYRLAGASWRACLVRWGADLAPLAVALVYVRSALPRRSGSSGDQLEHLRVIEEQARHLLASAGIQHGPTRLPGLAAVLILAAAVGAWAASRRGDPLRDALGRWLLTAVGGVGVIAAGYAPFVPSNAYYSPLAQGLGTRTNAAAGLGFAILFYALAVLASLAGARLLRLPRPQALAGLVAVTGAALLAVSWARAIDRDRKLYEQAYRLERVALDLVRTRIPSPAPGMTVYLFGLPRETGAGVFTFFGFYDFTGALRLLWDDTTVRGFAATWLGEEGITCGRRRVRADSRWAGRDVDDAYSAPYGKIVFIDVKTRSSQRIPTPAECRAALRRYLPDATAA